MSTQERLASPPAPTEQRTTHAKPRLGDVRLVVVTLAGAASLASGVLVALFGSVDLAGLLLITGGLVTAACLHRLGRAGPERD